MWVQVVGMIVHFCCIYCIHLLYEDTNNMSQFNSLKNIMYFVFCFVFRAMEKYSKLSQEKSACVWGAW